ncbi:hypothetical protein [Microbacterium lacticum]
MSEVIITVRGESDRRVAPERAVAHVTATGDGPERGAVVERIAALAEPCAPTSTHAAPAGSPTGRASA